MIWQKLNMPLLQIFPIKYVFTSSLSYNHLTNSKCTLHYQSRGIVVRAVLWQLLLIITWLLAQLVEHLTIWRFASLNLSNITLSWIGQEIISMAILWTPENQAGQLSVTDVCTLSSGKRLRWAKLAFERCE